MKVQRVVCARRTPCQYGSHIISVGLGEDPEQRVEVFAVAEVYAEMDRGASFVTSNDWHQAAAVTKGSCGCGVDTLLSEPGSAWQNDIARLKHFRGDGRWDEAESAIRTQPRWR
jgi:hypothetical protein